MGEEADRGQVKPMVVSQACNVPRRSGQAAARAKAWGQHDAGRGVSSEWMNGGSWDHENSRLTMGGIPLPETLDGIRIVIRSESIRNETGTCDAAKPAKNVHPLP